MSWKKEAGEIRRRRELAKAQGGPEAVEKQHTKGRLSLRERIGGLVDEGSFHEVGEGAGAAETDADGAVTDFTPANYILGIGAVSGRQCVIGGEDFTLKGGSPNAAGLRKSIYAEKLALEYRLPLVRFLEGGGGSVGGAKDGGGPVGDPAYAPPRFEPIAEALNTVPVVSAALGPVAGFPAARLAASHFTVMSGKTAQILVAGPAVVERALNRKLTKEELGGADIHLKNGVVDNLAQDEEDAFAQIRRFLSYMPDSVDDPPSRIETDDPAERAEEALLSLIPRDRKQVYDGRDLIRPIVDRDSFFEIGAQYGRGQIIGLARLDGHSIGVIGANPGYYAGAMTAAGAQKVRRFIELCDLFRLPIVSFVDEPGFMIGPDAEKAGTIRYGVDAALAAARSRVPWASVIVRKSFGVASVVHYGPDGFILAWPSAEVGALPVEGGVAVAYGREIAEADDPEARRAELEAKLAAKQSPFPRAESFSVHELIDPRETRPRLCHWIGLAVRRRDRLGGLPSYRFRV